MFEYLEKIEKEHFNEEDDLFKPPPQSEYMAYIISNPSIRLHALKLLIVPFYQNIGLKNMLHLILLDVSGVLSILWLPDAYACNDKYELTLIGMLACFFDCVLNLTLITAFCAIDLCFNLSVLCLSLITRAISTIAHMIIYAFSGDDASRYESNAVLNS